jgi:hypothetical protein
MQTCEMNVFCGWRQSESSYIHMNIVMLCEREKKGKKVSSQLPATSNNRQAIVPTSYGTYKQTKERAKR